MPSETSLPQLPCGGKPACRGWKIYCFLTGRTSTDGGGGFSGAPNLCRSHAIPGLKFGPLDRSNELAAHWCLGLYLNEADLGRRALSKCAQGSSSNKSDDGERNSKFDLRASVVHCHLRGIAA